MSVEDAEDVSLDDQDFRELTEPDAFIREQIFVMRNYLGCWFALPRNC